MEMLYNNTELVQYMAGDWSLPMEWWLQKNLIVLLGKNTWDPPSLLTSFTYAYRLTEKQRRSFAYGSANIFLSCIMLCMLCGCL